MESYLPVIWAAIIGLAVAMYVILDGFDLGIGMIMILAGLTGVLLWWRSRLFEARWYLWPAQHAWWMGFVAVISGWIVTETGRQPWVA